MFKIIKLNSESSESSQKDQKNSKAYDPKEYTKKLSVIEGMCWSAMVGFGTYFITPFALLFGASSFIIGIIRSLSTLATAAGQYIGAWYVRFAKRRKDAASTFAFIQALLWIPLLLPFVFPIENKPLIIVVIYSAISFFGALISPLWSSLMRDIVDKNERGRYFGLRNKYTGFIEFVSSIIAGMLLSATVGNPFLGFGLIFGISCVFRLISSKLLQQHHEIRLKPRRETFYRMIRLPHNRFFNNVLILSAGMVFATAIAGPFFAVYMLRDLGFDYLSFSISLAASTFAYIITQPYWGIVIDKYGTRPVLFATSVLIPFIPLLWLPVTNLSTAILVQLYSGVVWAGFDLSTFNFLLKVAPRRDVHYYAAHLNGLSSLATFCGGIAGSILIANLENTTIGLISGIQILFVISALARLIVVFIGVPRIIRNMSVDAASFLTRVITVYPIKGILAEITTTRNFVGELIGHRHR